MLITDFLTLSFSAVKARKLRTGLTSLGIAVGITAVVLLTSLGEGLHRFVLAEFTQFGTNLIGISLGKATTSGISGAVLNNVRPLTIEDASALALLPQVIAAVPLVQGNAAIEANRLQRRATVFGVNHQLPEVWQFKLAAGRFLPDDDPIAARAFIVLGSKIKAELFGNDNPLGQFVRAGGSRFRVIGVMESKGQLLGFDLDDAVYIPTAKSMDLFNRDSVMEIDILFKPELNADDVADTITKVLESRHGDNDFTVITQEQMLQVLSSILEVLTFAIGALGGISLLVGGVGILSIMTIAVTERTAEIGLLSAIGAQRYQILALFLLEAILLSLLGGSLGLLCGWGIAELVHWLVPAIPVYTSWQFALVAVALAVAVGLVAGVIPAQQAARMNPVDALRTE